MKTLNTIKAIVVVLVILALGYIAWKGGYIGFDDGKFWFNPTPAQNTIIPPPGYSPTPIVTIPPPEDFPSDVGGDSVFFFVEAEPTPLPPICSAFECNVELANNFWSQLPGAQGYVTSGNIVAAGIDLVHSASVQVSTPGWDWYGSTTKKVEATGRFFARAAINPSGIKVILNEKDNGGVTVTVIPPELCLDSAGIALVSPTDGRPVELRVEVAENYDFLYDTCKTGNFVACFSGISDNPDYDTVVMSQGAIQKVAVEAMSIISVSQELRQAYSNSLTGIDAPNGYQQNVVINQNIDQWNQPVAVSANDVLKLIGSGVACNILSTTGRTCDPELMEVIIQPPPTTTQPLLYCNGRPFTTTDISVPSWVPEQVPQP